MTSLTVQPWVNYLISACLTVFLHKIGTIEQESKGEVQLNLS